MSHNEKEASSNDLVNQENVAVSSDVDELNTERRKCS